VAREQKKLKNLNGLAKIENQPGKRPKRANDSMSDKQGGKAECEG